jgi:hypothetical protein
MRVGIGAPDLAARLVQRIAAAVTHAAEANARDIEAGAAELGVFHRFIQAN